MSDEYPPPRLGDRDPSESLSDPPTELDLPAFVSLRGLWSFERALALVPTLPIDIDRPATLLSSAPMLEMVVAANDELLREKRVSVLSAVVVVSVYVDARLATVRERLCEAFVDPEKRSPPPERPLKRLREIASSPKIAALERAEAVGVPGRES